jgi:hypothetical protein
VLVAGVLQLGVVYFGVRHAGMSIGLRFPRLTPNVKRLLILAVPAAITGGITQINQLIGQAIASSPGRRHRRPAICRPHLPASARRRRRRCRRRFVAGTVAGAEGRASARGRKPAEPLDRIRTVPDDPGSLCVVDIIRRDHPRAL